MMYVQNDFGRWSELAPQNGNFAFKTRQTLEVLPPFYNTLKEQERPVNPNGVA